MQKYNTTAHDALQYKNNAMKIFISNLQNSNLYVQATVVLINHLQYLAVLYSAKKFLVSLLKLTLTFIKN